MRIFLLDGRRMAEKAETHQYLKEMLQFPDYYGENLDALYDCLTEINEKTRIEILLKDVTSQAYIRDCLPVFWDAEEENPCLEISCSEE